MTWIWSAAVDGLTIYLWWTKSVEPSHVRLKHPELGDEANIQLLPRG